MNIGEGDAADRVMRLALEGSEIAVRLSGSTLKNGLALLLACIKNNKKVYGKTNMLRLFRETRDLRMFKLTTAQFKAFKKASRKYGILYSAVRDRKSDGLVSLIFPATEIERANLALEKIAYFPETGDIARQKEETEQKKESRSGRNSRDTRDSSSTRDSAQKTRNERPSLLKRLTDIREQYMHAKDRPIPTREIVKKGKAR